MYFLINGRLFPDFGHPCSPWTDDLAPFERQQARHVPRSRKVSTVIAEDGYLLNYPRREFAPSLSAGKTLDIISAPTTTGYHAFYDRRLGMSNAGAYPGGMLTFMGDLNCSTLRGDVSGDSRITAVDALTVLQAFVAGTTNTLPVGADVSLEPISGLPCGDGTVDLVDVLMLLQKATGFNPY
jgi:hypothetical protein